MDDVERVQMLGQSYQRLKTELAKRIVGQEAAIESLLICLLAGGHCLLVGVPGLAKTLLVRSLGEVFELGFNRVQFTPDLMPTDITGTEVIQENRTTGERVFRFVEGPIFSNMILADELNRTPPKTQAALLEAMQEKQVTAGGKKHPLPNPFFVLATQNPIEQEGTYPLPEAQLDRFMFQVSIDYPTAEEELKVILNTTSSEVSPLDVVVPQAELAGLMSLVGDIPVAEHVAEFALNLVRKTRPQSEACSKFAKQYTTWGAGPRGGQNLVLAGKAHAALHGRNAVELEDIRAVCIPALAHRVRTNFTAEAEGVTSVDVIRQIIEETNKEPEFRINGLVPNLLGSKKSQ
ncbi:MAG: MoxR family ATPase [Pirellulaceae bacterium]|nr:MoxR family ATPase [Pirellulaceae bacterium]